MGYVGNHICEFGTCEEHCGLGHEFVVKLQHFQRFGVQKVNKQFSYIQLISAGPSGQKHVYLHRHMLVFDKSCHMSMDLSD